MSINNTQQTPRSAARQQERSNRILDSPVHRRIPQSDSTTLSENLGVQPQQSSLLEDDPFVDSTSSPSVARSNLAALMAAADETSRVISSVRVRRGRPRGDCAIPGPSTTVLPVAGISAGPSATGLSAELSTTVENLPLNLHENMENLHQNDAPPAVNQQPPPPLASMLLPPARRPFNKDHIQHSNLGSMNVICSSCKALHWKAERLSKSSLRNPKFGMCCYSGKIQLPPLHPLPPELATLYRGQDPISKNFRNNIRQYNNALAMTSVGQSPGVKLGVDHNINRGGGPWVYKVKGALHHIAGSLVPNPGRNPCFAQLYIYDPTEALEYRMQSRYNTGLDRYTMQTLQDMLYRHHPSVSKFKQAYEQLKDISSDRDFQIGLRFNKDCDKRRYNLPTSGSTEVAVIIPGNGDQQLQSRDIVLFFRGGGLKLITEMSPIYHSLHFVLLFPTGQLSWHPELAFKSVDEGLSDEYLPDEHGEELQPEPGHEVGDVVVTRKKRTCISQAEYFRYRLFSRQVESDHIFRAAHLFQEYTVDMWAATEQSRLSWLNFNQNTIRADVYQGLVDAVRNADGDSQELGQRVILPSSFTGSTRNMIQYYQDSLAITRHFGGADLFLTMTADPKWPEIESALLPGQAAADRPDLVCRVFQAKLQELLTALTKDQALGKVLAYIYTIEFQKRTLPHVHMVLCLQALDKLRSPDTVDTLISAEFPDEHLQPELYALVKKYMVHGPCGPYNPNSPCMVDGKCSKNFPKPFRETTSISEDSYAVYRRCNDGQTHTVRQHEVDNRWIVPYSPWLLYKFRCHFNVESIGSVKAIKYIHKYIYKGHDRISMDFGRCRDEIQQYLDARFVGSNEACWRLFMFDVHREFPNVVRLQVHLPNQQYVVWNSEVEGNIEDVVDRAAVKDTTLTAFFKANAKYEEGQQMLYHEYPQKFTLVQRTKEWKLRQRGFAIGRLYYVSPVAGERFYLRTLLNVVKGSKSFSDLLSYQGIRYSTFRETCLARGLLEDDGEWVQCLQDASAMQTGKQLRSLFVMILRDCLPAQPDQLWMQFRHHICDDLKYALRLLGHPDATDEEVYDYGLYCINQLLEHTNKSLRDYPPMPLFQRNWQDVVGNRLIAEQRNYDPHEQQAKADERIPMLNADQRRAFDIIMEAVESKSGKCFFLNGPGGTGKTFVYNTLCYALRALGKIVLCVASSGIAALLLIGGRTSHSRLKIPILIHESSMCSIKKNSMEAELIKAADLIIWDEAPSQHRHIHEAVDRTLQDIRDCNQLFGGLSVVFGGDFRQTLPVIEKGSKEEIVNASLGKSHIWSQLTVLSLTINMRLGDDQCEREFAEWQLNVGQGDYTDDNANITLPDHFKCAENTLGSLIEAIYPSISDFPHPSDQYFSEHILLSARNEDVHAINAHILNNFPGSEHIYHSADSVGSEGDEEDIQHFYPVEHLNSINASGLPLAKLALKKGCPVMVLRNLNPSQGVCNGTRGILTRMTNRVLEIRLLSGDHAGEHVFIPRITMIPSAMQIPFELRRRQFPICLAFAMTINKAQGQSVKYVGLDFRSPVFTHGQFYVAISRATSVHRIKAIWDPNNMRPVTKNVVYKSVLLDN